MTKEYMEAYQVTMQHEGGYANNSNDRGGETYCGISRRFHPEWAGWKLIDAFKVEYGVIKINTVFPQLATLVMHFYYIEYWLANGCDKMSGDLAGTVFDMAVNHGSGKTIQLLQRSLNAANRNQKLWKNTAVDGLIGSATIACINKALIHNKINQVNVWLNCLRGAFFIEIMESDEWQEEFATSWASRIRIERK